MLISSKSILINAKKNHKAIFHFEHGSSFESCKKAIDASKENFDKNIEITKMVVEYAHLKNVTGKTEIEIMGQNLKNDLNISNKISVNDCIEFIKKTNIDSLAPAVGTAHDLYNGITKININSDLQDKWSNSVRLYLETNKNVIDLRKIISSGMNSIKQEIDLKMNINN